MSQYPPVFDAEKIGTYDARAFAGGGYVWDEVLEYRVWCHLREGAEDIEDGSDYYYMFDNAEDAIAFSNVTKGAIEPLALVLQREYIDEPEPEQYIHVKTERMTEWPLSFLSRPRRTSKTIPEFLSADAPENRLAILRGEA